jgi:hypothetical protein
MALAAIVLLVTTAACTWPAKSRQELERHAERAVNWSLQGQGTYYLLESSVHDQIACGRVHIGGPRMRDVGFVYDEGYVVLEGEPGFTGKIRHCDQAARIAD